MNDTLVTVYTEAKKSKVLELIKNSSIEVNTQHVIFKKGLFIDFQNECNNIIVIEVKKDIYHIALENITRLGKIDTSKYIIVLLEEDFISPDEFTEFQMKFALRGICTSSWGGPASIYTISEKEEILDNILKEIKNEN